MKTIKFILLFAMLTIGGKYSTLLAQKKIETLIDSCKNFSGVDAKEIVRYDKNLIDVEYITKTLCINNNEELANRFIQIFEEEKKNSNDIVIEKFEEGKLVSACYNFSEEHFNVTSEFTRSDSSKIEIIHRKTGKK